LIDQLKAELAEAQAEREKFDEDLSSQADQGMHQLGEAEVHSVVVDYYDQ
jgi:hypothetical protein